MYHTKWFSFKHNSWAIVSDEKPVSEKGYYLIKFESGIYRRYNEERINSELAEFYNLNEQLDAQLMPTQYKRVSGEGAPYIESVGEIESSEYVKVTAIPQTQGSGKAKSKKKEGVLINLVFAWRE